MTGLPFPGPISLGTKSFKANGFLLLFASSGIESNSRTNLISSQPLQKTKEDLKQSRKWEQQIKGRIFLKRNVRSDPPRSAVC